MADDHYSRPPRPSNPLARPQSARRTPPSGGDPLAELARLIGQSDPYAAYAQTPPSAGSAGTQRPYAQDEESGWRGAPDPYSSQQDPYAQQSDYQDGYGADAAYNPPPAYQDQSYPAPQAGAQDYGSGYGDQAYNDQNYNEPYYGDQHYAGGAPHQDRHYAPEGYAPQSYPPQSYPDPQYSERMHDARYGDAQQPEVPQFASPQYDDKPYPAYDNQLYANQAPAFPPAHGDPHAAHRQPVPNGQGYSGAYYNDPNAPAFGAPYYHEAAPEAEEAPARRRGGLVTVLAVLALAVVGTAAAFGYRAVFAPAGTRVPPPVIKADTSPSKIVPANDKPIQDRVGDRAQIERIINREEQPVDVNTARAGAPRVVFPGPNPIAPLPNSPIPQSPATQASTPTGTAAAASTEPKKVRTVTIRSDQPELAAAANATAAATSAPRANIPSGVLPEDDPRNAARAQAGTQASHGPLSLSPSTVQSAQRAAPVRTASAPAASGGGYSVQVTSQRSEGEAQAAYAALQAKFPSVLGNRQALIRRADLGEKGTYYRAQIPFGSQGEAADFCTNLRSAGGQCVIQRN